MIRSLSATASSPLHSRRDFAALLIVIALLGAARADAQTSKEYDQGRELFEARLYDDAIDQFSAAIKSNENDKRSLYYRGLSYKEKRENDKALADFNRAIALDPKASFPFVQRAEIWVRKGKDEKAMEDCAEALKLDPKNGRANIVRGMVYYFKREYPKALEEYNRGLKLRPDDAEGYYDRAHLRAIVADYAGALADYDRVMQLDPDCSQPFNNAQASRAWLLATCADPHYRDGKKALQEAKKYYESHKDDWNNIDSIAAAYAECGDFKSAIEWENKAIDMASDHKDERPGEPSEFRSRVKLFEHKMPYHEEDKLTSGKRASQLNKLHLVVLAASMYQVDHNAWPPAYIAKDGKPLLSWRVALLPLMGETKLYNRFHLDEPWDSPHNLQVAKDMPSEFQSPYRKEKDDRTTVMLFTGKGTPFGSTDGVARVTDYAKTIFCVATAPEKAVPWTKPDNLPFDPRHPHTAMGIRPTDGFLAGFFDGSTHHMSADEATLAAMIAPASGERVEEQEQIYWSLPAVYKLVDPKKNGRTEK